MAARYRRTIAFALLFLPAVLNAGDSIEIFGLRWAVPIPADWKVENVDGVPTLNLLVPRPSEKPRRPSQYALADTPDYLYVHLSDDNTNPEAHNGVFHVLGGDRVRISSFEGPPALTREKWYKVRMVYDGRSGKVEMFVDGETSPALRAVEMSLTAGQIGIGSFFDMGQFRNVKIHGER